MKKLLLTLTLAAASAATLPAANPTIYGVYGYMNGYSKTTGVYKFQAETPNTSEALYTYTGMNPYECGSVILEDRIVYIEPFSTYSKPILKVTRFTDIDDPGTYTRDGWVENLPNTSANTALCVDPISKKIYGFFFNEDKSTFFFGTLDPETGLSTKIKDIDLGSRPNTIAINNYGVVYAITQGGKLFKGSYEGEFEEVGTLSVRTSGSSSRSGAAVFDPVDDTFYWVIYDSNYDYSFCVIDPATAQVEKTVQGLGSASALYIPTMALDDAAPAPITDLSVSAEGFDTNITVSFTAPNMTVGGSTITAGLRPYIAIDGNIVLDGTTVVGPGNPVTASFDVTDGSHTIVAWVTTSGNSPLASEKTAKIFFAGQDKPEAVSDLTVSQAEDHNSVTLTWTAPTVGAGGGNFDTASLSYTVNILPNDKGEEGEELTTGLTDCTYTYELPNQDLRFLQFEVVPVTNSVTGIAAKTETIVVGEDFPGKVSDLTATQEDGKIVLSWTAPTEGQNGSYFDSGSLKYNVILLPNEVVASELSGTTYTYPVVGSDMRRLQFEVKAETRKGEGDGVQSDAFIVGDAYAVPYFEDFESITDNFDEIFYTVINVNDDAKYWAPYSSSGNKTARITYTSSNGVYQDDWLITAPIKLNQGRVYNLSFDALLSNPTWGTENLEVLVGDAPIVDGMSINVNEYEYSVSKTTSTGSFSVPEDGVYYIGFHCVSPGNHGNLDLDNIALDVEPEPATTGNLVAEEVTLEYLAGDTTPVTATIPVSLENLDGQLTYMGYQFELTLPVWLTVNGASVGEGLAGDLVYNFLNEDDADKTENTYRFIAALNTNEGLGYTATEGIAQINVSADRANEAYLPGTYQSQVSEVIFSSVSGRDINFIIGMDGDIIVNDATNYILTIGTPTAMLEEPSYDNSGKPLTAITTGEGLEIVVPVTYENASTENDEELTWTVTADGNEIDGSCLTYEISIDEENGTTAYIFSFDSSDIEGNVEITFSAEKANDATYGIEVVAVLLGDSNFNGDVTVADVVATANFIVDNEDVRFDYPNANIIVDDTEETPSRDGITVQDVNATVDIILGARDAQGNPKAVRRHAAVMASSDALVIDGFKVNRNDVFTIPVNLENTNAYTSIQATIIVPEGMEVRNVTRGERALDHRVAFNIKDNGVVKVVVYSVTNNAFANGEGSLFNLEVVATEECGNISIEGIKAADARCNGYTLGFDGGRNVTGTTGIDGIDADEQGVRYFTVDGIEVFNPEKGQILIRVKDGESTKVVK